MNYDQEKSILEATDKLYQIAEAFDIDVEFVRDISGYIAEQIKTQTGIDVDGV